MKKEFKSLLDFLNYFKNETVCEKYLEKERFQNGEFCPHCGTVGTLYRIKSGYKCPACRKNFTIRYGTIFSRSPIPLKKWFTAIFILSYHSKGISSVQLAKDLGVTQKTAWFMNHRIRTALNQDTSGFSFQDDPSKDVYEIDETYVGGKESNKHSSKRVEGTG